MSGGSYEYFYSRMEDFSHNLREEGGCSAASPAARRAFANHILLCAKAARAIEWNDSGDGDGDEERLLHEILGIRGTYDAACEKLLEAAKLVKSVCSAEVVAENASIFLADQSPENGAVLDESVAAWEDEKESDEDELSK